jgi:hypothetical protein
VNGHASVANSAALRSAGITEESPDPNGGSFGRSDDGKLNGVLFESAHEVVSHRAPLPTLEEMVEAILLACERMSDFGICCASDMMTGRFDLDRELTAYQIAADRGAKVMTRLYLQWGEVFSRDGGWRDEPLGERIESYVHRRTRVGGIKIFADGAIGSATAAIYGSYSGIAAPGPTISQRAISASTYGSNRGKVSGQLIYSPERLSNMVRVAHDAGFQIAIHSIGDYSTDLVMDAYEALGDCSKHRIEHAMLLSDAQIERMAKLGCFCTMQPEFLMRFRHSYLRQLGEERTSKLERMRSVKDAGIPLSLSSDRPIVGGDPADGIATAIDRPAGFDPSENLTFHEAVDAYTQEASRANLDHRELGELGEGQLAFFRLAQAGRALGPKLAE